jgi:hypothetical protein
MTSDRAERLLQGGEREKRGSGLYQGSDQMRALVLACLAALAGCNDPIRVENFTADTPATFTYDAWTNTVMTANDDGAAEQIRRGWLAEALADHGMCAAGYVVETRRFEQPWEGPFGNGGDIVYSGRCL